jgi:hypothetical protein
MPDGHSLLTKTGCAWREFLRSFEGWDDDAAQNHVLAGDEDQ